MSLPSLANFAARLSIQRPSPTTTLYTVSNARSRPTKISQISRLVGLAARLLLALWCALSLVGLVGDFAWSQRNSDGNGYGFSRDGMNARWSSMHGLWGLYFGIENVTDSRLTWGLVAGCMLMLWVLSRRESVEESMLCIRGLGIQISTSSRSYLSTASTRFIPTAQIQDIFIHEAFKGFEVRFYLAVIVESEKEAVVVFPKLLPRRDILEEVWRGSRNVLYQPAKR